MVKKLLGMKPREITLIFKGQKLDPKTLFEIFYKGLEALVELNISKFKTNNRSPTGRKYSPHEGLDKEEKDLFQKWKQSFSDEDASAEIIFDEKTRKTFSLKRRTNFDLSIIKIPSIIYIQGENCEGRAILREARTYDIKKVLAKLAHRTFGVQFNEELSKQFHYGNNKGVNPPQRKSDVIYLPEPQLLIALESLYNQNFPRITPEIFVVEGAERELWYLRDLLPTLVNADFDFKSLGNYFGACHSLGLMDRLDRQAVHYCKTRQTVVNFDPDVITHTRKITTLNQTDIDDLVSKLKQEESAYKIHVFDDDIKTLRKASEESRRKLEEEGFNQETLFKYLSQKVNLENVRSLNVELIK